jgi:hypothetical protein
LGLDKFIEIGPHITPEVVHPDALALAVKTDRLGRVENSEMRFECGNRPIEPGTLGF